MLGPIRKLALGEWSQGLLKIEGGLRSPQEKQQIVCRRENVWCWDAVGEFESETV